MSGYDPPKSKPSPRPGAYNPLLSASLQVDDFAARIMPAAPPPPPPEVKPVIYASTPDILSMTATSSAIGGSAIREETFSDISLAPSTMASPFVGGGGQDQASLQMHQTNPLEDLDAFGQGGSSIIGGMSSGGQGYDQGHSGSSYTSGGGGNTATEMLINQASSITANFQQALPAVASTVFSHFSNYLKGGTPQPKPQETQIQNPQGFGGTGFDGGINQPQQYVSPLDDIYHQQMSNPTESVNQMPLFISPQDAPTPGQMAPSTGAGVTAQNTYRIGGQKKKTYAPPPIQGFSTQTPGSFTPGYDPTAPIQSGAPVMPPLPPMPGQQEKAPQVTPIPQRPPSVPQMQPPEIASNHGARITPAPTPPAPTMTPTPMFMPSQAMEQPGFPPLPPQNQPQQYQQDQPPQPSFFQQLATPAFTNPPPTSQYNPEPEKSKFSLTSFFTSNPIIDRLQGKSPNQYEGNSALQHGYQANEGAYQQFAGIGVGSNTPPQPQQSPMPTINPNVFNTNPLQAPPMAPPSVPTLNPGENAPMNPNSAMGSFFNPQQQQSAIQPPMVSQSPSFPAAATGFNPPPPSMIPSTQGATSQPPPMQEPPKALGSGVSAPGGYRMTKSRPAYANPNLIAQSQTTSGFMAMDRPGEAPAAPTQWFNPAGAVTPAPEVAPQQSQNFFTPGVSAANEVKHEVPPTTQWFNPTGSVASAPELAPPPPQMSSFFTPGAPPTPTEVKQETSTPPPTPIDGHIPQAPFQMPSVPITPQPMLFNPAMINTQEVNVTRTTPDLIVPPPQGPAKEEGNVQQQSFFTPTEIQAPIQKEVIEQPPPPPTSGFTPNPTPTPPAPAVAQLNPITSSNFFDSASFGGPQQPQKEENVQPMTFGNLSNEQQNVLQTTTSMFQPVNFFNAFSTQPTPQQLGTKEAMINEQLNNNQSEGDFIQNASVFQPPPSSSTPALEPVATMPVTFEPATLPMDNNANNILTSTVESTGQQQEINTEVITAGQGEVPVTGGNFWSERDDNANIVASEILSPPSVATTAHTDSFFNVSTTAVRADETLEEDFLSSFEKVDNSKFFDSPPDVQPTDPIANPNFFKSFMKAKFNATLMDEFNDQSLVVEPPSHDDSSISLSSYPSFDQSSSAPMGSVTDSGFQVINPNFDELSAAMSRMSTSPSMPLPTDMDGLPTVTRSRTGSMSSQVSNTSRPVATGPYRPVYKHWFYSYKDGNSKIKWVPMTMRDSLAVETAFMDPSFDTSKLISTDGGRHDVYIKQRKRMAVYWQAEPNEVRRCSWFYKTIDCSFVPFEEDHSELLENEFKDAHESKQWQRKITLPNGEIVQIHDFNLMMHYISTTNEGSWGSTSSQTTVKRVVKRGVDEFNIEDGEPDKIDHVLFMVHGIGASCDLKFRSVEEVVDEFRSIAHQMVQSHYRTSYDSGNIGRIEVLPISWHSELHSEESGIDAKLKAITLESIPKIRSLANETILDVLFYTSPKFCQHIIEIVSGSLNKLYTLFCQRNPQFSGGISLAGHSLGSLILFDLLAHQKAEPENRENLVAKEGEEEHHAEPTNYQMGLAGTTGQPLISYPQLLFTASNFFALGSPIGMFVTVRGIDNLGLDFKLPTCERFFNIFHPYDPVAYRIESMINSECTALQPVLIPHHKGRKRMHLELRETMERVKGDLKARLLSTFKSTLDTVTQFKAFSRTDTSCITSEVDKVLDEQLQMNGSGSDIIPVSPVPTAANSDVDPGETDLPLGRLNQGRRIDYVLQEAPLEFFNGYLFALTSHVCYWESEDTTLFVVKEIYSSMGVGTDDKIPQGSLTIERPSN